MEDLTFLDLAVLQRIDENTVVENFGPKINSSFFDAANILGSLKKKEYVDFTQSFPGPARVVITEKGRGILALSEEKASQELDVIDERILRLIGEGYKEPHRIEEKINLRSADLAFHLNRLVKQNYASYVFRSGRIFFSLTDEGFKRAGIAKFEETERKEGEDIEALTSAPKEEKPKKLDRETMVRAKMEYYYEEFKRRLPHIALVLLILLVIIAYLVFFRG